MRAAIAAANNRIFELRAATSTTRAWPACSPWPWWKTAQITIGHVGDSRLYLIWNGAIRKLTSDHSPVGEDEDAGELTEQEAMRHPRRNEVFRDVGTARARPATMASSKSASAASIAMRPSCCAATASPTI